MKKPGGLRPSCYKFSQYVIFNVTARSLGAQAFTPGLGGPSSQISRPANARFAGVKFRGTGPQVETCLYFSTIRPKFTRQ